MLVNRYPLAYETNTPIKNTPIFPFAINNAKGSPDTPIATAPTLNIAIAAPPTAAPKQAPINGLPRGKVIPYINGSPIPKNPGTNPFLAIFFNLSFFVFLSTAIVAPTCAIPAVASIGNNTVYPTLAIKSACIGVNAWCIPVITNGKNKPPDTAPDITAIRILSDAIVFATKTPILSEIAPPTGWRK